MGRQATFTAALAWAGLAAACSFQAHGDGGSDLDDQVDDRDDVVATSDAASGIDGAGAGDAAPSPDALVPEVPGVMRAAPAVGDIEADGDDAEYAGAHRYEVALGSDAGNYIDVDGYAPSMAASVRVVHDQDYVAWFIEVTDSVPRDDDLEAYLDDAVSLYIDYSGGNDGPWAVKDREIIVDIGGTVELYNDSITDPLLPIIDSQTTMIVGGYSMELRLHRGTYWLADAASVGFNLALFDDDGGDTGVYFPSAYGLWYDAPGPRCDDCCDLDVWGRPEAWCDTTFNGTLVLQAE